MPARSSRNTSKRRAAPGRLPKPRNAGTQIVGTEPRAPHIGQVAGIGVESGGTSGRPVAVDSLTLRKIEISRCSISTDTRRVRFMATMCHAKPRRVIGRGSKARQFRLNCTSIQRVAPFGGGFLVMNGRITAARRRPAKYGSIPAKEPLRSFTRATRRGPTRPATPHADKIRP